MTNCYSNAAARLQNLIHDELRQALGHLDPKRIVIKPNWVMHEFDPTYPISALVSDARVIEATVRACVALFPKAEQITIGDCLEQRADWPLMCRQSGLAPIIEKLTAAFPGQVVFRDLRKEVYREVEGSLILDPDAPHGDPAGYCEVQLNGDSHLEPIADQADSFSIHDHDVTLTRNYHRTGDHRYLVSQTVLDADLVINIPKWKAHSKAGLTGALKNLVGINGDKSYLPHFRRGSPRWGGDEYCDEGRWLYWAHNSLHDLVRGTFAYHLLKPGWKALKQINNAVRRRSKTQSTPSDFYAVGGSWHGNQTVWRMVYDLNLIIQRADRLGRLQPTSQREYFCIVDGLVSGEGDGPLKPQPRATDFLFCGSDPFEIDTVLSWFMGFDPAKIPSLSQRRQYLGVGWGKFELPELVVALDGSPCRLMDSDINFRFLPPPGWIGHIERTGRLNHLSTAPTR